MVQGFLPRLVEAKIINFAIGESTGLVDQDNHTVAVTVPSGTTVTALKATFTLNWLATAKVGDVAQESGVTENDFTNPVSYVITAPDGTTTATYTVTVTVEEAEDAGGEGSGDAGGEGSGGAAG